MVTSQRLFVNEDNMALCTDLYELTMAAGYFANDAFFPATFDLSVRRLPRHRKFLIQAGLEQALDFLQSLRFAEDAIRRLRALPPFRRVLAAFFDYLPPGKLGLPRLCLADEKLPEIPLLKCMMRGGRIVGKLPSLQAIRERARRQVAALPARLRTLTGSGTYPVRFSEGLRTLRRSIRELDGGIDR